MKRKATALMLLVACGTVPTATIAEEQAEVYESLDDVKIGRIFLSPAQRSSLDARRGKAPVATEATVAERPAGTARISKSPDAAGYILRSGGPTKVWSNGNFVPADDASAVTFPGDVEVLRKAVPEKESNSGASDEGS